MQFKLVSDFKPAGDQPQAIEQLVREIGKGAKYQTLLGVTGSGKTFTMANVIERLQVPTLVISHNKTLAAQLFQEFKAYFPDNAVEYFVSFYDYYQPEAYIPSTDTYIEKTSDINDEIDRLRLKATSSLMSRRDVIIVASVSCIYNIGSPETYAAVEHSHHQVDAEFDRDRFLRQACIDMQYTRNDMSFERRNFRVKGDVIDVYPAYEETALRIETFGDCIERHERIHPLPARPRRASTKSRFFRRSISWPRAWPSKRRFYKSIRNCKSNSRSSGRRASCSKPSGWNNARSTISKCCARSGFVSGIENYSRILDGREPAAGPRRLSIFSRPRS